VNDALQVAADGGTWTFTLNRPDKRNALSAALVERLIDAVAQAHAEAATLLVFRGEGVNFSAGFDFADFESQSEGELLLRFVRIEMLLQALSASPAMTVALAHGRNFGAGVDLIGVCRERIAAPGSSFRMPGLKFGLVLGTRRFGGLVGAANARRVLEQAASFDAEAARAMGFVTGIATTDEWPAALAAVEARASLLDPTSRAALFAALADDRPDADLAALVRSAARPGLKGRIRHYLAAASRT